jgi:hypothetical protein
MAATSILPLNKNRTRNAKTVYSLEHTPKQNSHKNND